MKNHRKRKIISICVLFIAVGITFFLLSSNKPDGDRTTTDDIVMNHGVAAPLEDAKTPLEYTQLENLNFLIYQLENNRCFTSTTTGESKASVATQKVSGQRIVLEDYAFNQTITSSSFVKLGEQRIYLYGQEKVLIREAESNLKSFKNNITEKTYESDFDEYGSNPMTFASYVLSKDTIKSTSKILKNDENYEITYNLIPTIAPVYYQRKIKYNSGSSEYPVFSSISLKMTFNSKWQILSIETEEKYEVKIKLIGWINTSTKLVETFDYSSDLVIPDLTFWEPYLK